MPKKKLKFKFWKKKKTPTTTPTTTPTNTPTTTTTNTPTTTTTNTPTTTTTTTTTNTPTTTTNTPTTTTNTPTTTTNTPTTTTTNSTATPSTTTAPPTTTPVVITEDDNKVRKKEDKEPAKKGTPQNDMLMEGWLTPGGDDPFPGFNTEYKNQDNKGIMKLADKTKDSSFVTENTDVTELDKLLAKNPTGKGLKQSLEKSEIGNESSDTFALPFVDTIFSMSGSVREFQEKDMPLLGVGSAIANAIDVMLKIWKVVKVFKEEKKKEKDFRSDGARATSVADLVFAAANTAMGFAGAFKDSIKEIPIVGSVLGALQALISIGINSYRIGKVRKHGKAIDEQKTETKEKLFQDHDKRQSDADKRKEKEGFPYVESGKKGKKQIKRKNLVTRRNFLEREIVRLEADPNLSDDDKALLKKYQEELNDLYEYGVVKELQTKGTKTKRTSGFDIGLDIARFGASLASIDPTIGSIVGASVMGAASITKAVHKVVSYSIHKSRDSKAKKTNATAWQREKSSQGKQNRRSNLSKYMVGQIMELGEVRSRVENKDTKADVKRMLNVLDTGNKLHARIKAMSAPYPVLMKAKNRATMESLLEQSFSREGLGQVSTLV